MDLIQSALCCSHVGASSKHPLHPPKALEAQRLGFWKRVSKAKNFKLKNFMWNYWFSKGLIFRGAFFSMYRMDLIQSAQCCPHPGSSSKHLQHSSQAHRNLYTDTWIPETWILEVWNFFWFHPKLKFGFLGAINSFSFFRTLIWNRGHFWKGPRA